ncbi:MAG: flagellar biosynthesis protein FlhF [Desulfobacteraceae bacterium]|nr:flagellar biosynthesis protein FlhF [Desulfobacteraceae bacterium]
MKVKTFRGRSVQQAVSMIKSEIGPDAVILSTKRVPKNRTNPYGEQVFEVTASLPEDEPCTEPVKTLAEKTVKSYYKKDFKKSLENFDFKPSENKNQDDILTEIQSIKDILFTLQKNENLPEYIFRFPGASSVYSRLVESGVSSELAGKIIKRAYSMEKNFKSTPDSFRKRVFEDIVSLVETKDPFEEQGQRYAAAFIGPTGVGKTTTIAKIAADLTINKGMKVGLVSVDNYRIGALEQLKTYAAILGVPFMPAFDRGELEKVLSRMRSRDVILIDTAGTGSYDAEKINELKKIFSESVSVSSHLVLSLTSSRENLREASLKFSELNPCSYVFTKIDETKNKGHILDQIEYMNLPVSFVTNGQRVPEDIEKASSKLILKRIFV